MHLARLSPDAFNYIAFGTEDIFHPANTIFAGNHYRHDEESDTESVTTAGYELSSQFSASTDNSWSTEFSIFPYPYFWGLDPSLEYPAITIDPNRVAARVSTGIIYGLIRYGINNHIPVGDVSPLDRHIRGHSSL